MEFCPECRSVHPGLFALSRGYKEWTLGCPYADAWHLWHLEDAPDARLAFEWELQFHQDVPLWEFHCAECGQFMTSVYPPTGSTICISCSRVEAA